jgi:hypothetical protein
MRALEKKSNDRYASAGIGDAFCSTVEEMPRRSGRPRWSHRSSWKPAEAGQRSSHSADPQPVMSTRSRLIPWALTALLLVALCGTVFALNSLVIRPPARAG